MILRRINLLRKFGQNIKYINTPVDVKNILLTVFILNKANYRALFLGFFVLECMSFVLLLCAVK